MSTDRLPDGTIMVQGKRFGLCRYCRQWIRVDKFLFGAMHLCLAIEEREAIDRARRGQS